MLTNHEKIVGLRVKTYSYLKDNNYEEKKAKAIVSHKNLKFKDYKRCLTASQIENKLNYFFKKIDAGCLNKDKKEFVKETNFENTTKI